MKRFDYEKKPYYDCADCIDAAFYFKYGQDIRPRFANKFNFNVTRDQRDPVLDTVIQTEYRKDNFVNLYSELDFYEVSSSGKNMNFVEEMLKVNGILGVRFDSYFCNWSKYYRRLHRDHMILIVAMDKERKLLHIYDKYFLKESQVLTFTDFNLGVSSYIYYNKRNSQVTITPYDILKHSHALITEAARKNAIIEREQELRNFFKWIEQINFETGNLETIDTSNFCLSMTYIWWSRLCYLEFMQWMNQFENMGQLIYDLKKCCDLWHLFRNSVYKNLIYQKNTLAKRIVTYEQQIIDIEVSCIRQVEEIVIKYENERGV